HVDCIYIRQNEALGLGHAVLCAKKAIGDEPFAVLLADDLIDGRNTSCLAQMTDVFDRTGESVIAVERVSHDMTDQYGIVEVEDEISNPARIKSIVEKPRPDLAPSNLGVVGRYILTPEIFSLLEHTGEGSGGEIQLTDAISELLKQQSINAFQFNGIRYDCGSRAGFLRANIEYAAKDQELKELLVSFVADLKQRPDN
ncbi:MAG: UTP--glucose-1-phosphate uridylyltransferase, partial [Sedimenticola sp.]|nr:UTP--glucose-1-phosphate uridylyltransferase [Sedimenticola sp.]